MSKSRFFHISRTGKLVSMPTPKAALAAASKGGYVWLDYFRPTKEDLSTLTEPLGLHELSIEDCLDENQIPKIDDYPRNTFILFNAFHYSSDILTTTEVDAFLGKNFLVTVTGQNSENQWLLKDAEKVVELDSMNCKQGPAFLLHIILDQIVDQKFIAIDALEEKLNKAEEAILDNLTTFDPAELMHLRRDLLAVRKSLFHEREVLVKICRKDSPFIPEKGIYLYRDIYDHLSKFFELTESYRDLVTSLMEMYMTMLNNQMTRAANETNVTVRRLTFITTIFMPLTLLAGIGGMSEWSMMTGPENWRITYPAFLLAMIVLGIANYYLLKWLDNRRTTRENRR
ncbi:Mg2+/Co2+ transporter [bacterium]|nr:Mg2+/Co2+ transporter [bacterium]